MTGVKPAKWVKKDLAFNLYQELKGFIKQHGVLFLEIGRLLKTFKDNQFFTFMGHDTFASFVADTEIGLQPSTARAYIYIYEIYIQKYGYPKSEIAQVPWYKLRMIAPSLKGAGKKRADELLTKAKSLSANDLRIELKEEKANEGFADFKPFPNVYRCKTCGNWIVGVDEKDICKGH